MPRFDKTGPQGMGPMTGRKMGACGRSGGGFRGEGGAMGRGMGRGMGRRAGRGAGRQGMGAMNRAQGVLVDSDAEAYYDELENQVEQLQAEVGEIKGLLMELTQKKEANE